MRFLPSRKGRKIFGEIANEYDLVYFGDVDPRVDADYKMVRGLTANPNVRDQNYTTGNVYDYEVAFLQRSQQVVLVDGQKATREWTILQVQLKQAHVPHFLIDERKRTGEYGSNLAATQRWQEVVWQGMTPVSEEFVQAFAIYAQSHMVAEIFTTILTPEVQTMLASHFADFDYELDDDQLIVYATNAEITLQTLDHMLRIGLWFARKLDS
ncbi:hypothetical protein FWG95_03205 [Candidatus Saccharibacteria bacterium]|nr:hypothetical protein [Candidatus Saccharibacteria bacterium]